MKKYTSYHTSIKLLAKRNTLPDSYYSAIDRSTIWRWKNESDSKYFGSELQEVEVLESFISRKEAQVMMKTYMKVVLLLVSAISGSKSFYQLLRNNKEGLVHAIHRYHKKIDTRLVLRLLKIPVSVFYYWKNKVLYKCEASPLKLCKRVYPLQLTVNEVLVIKELVSSEQFKYWPICSLAWYATRENLLHISLATWYKYIHILGLNRTRIRKKKRYPTGIVATETNQIWHADITVVKSLDGLKSYVYLLMDNFSKYIINWRIEPVVSGEIRVQTIMDGYQQHINQNKDVQLIVDGGPENNNHKMDVYLNSSEINIQKLIALKDIPFSNSLIEAQNKILKYRYLFKYQYQDIGALRNALDWIIPDYNDQRPHNSLKGLTPYEAFTGKTFDIEEHSDKMKQSKQNRLTENKKRLCEIC
jgi:putative transposase